MSDDSLVLSMNTEIPIKNNMTVNDLIAVLEMVPDKRATVSVNVIRGDRWASDSYKLAVRWTKVMNNES